MTVKQRIKKIRFTIVLMIICAIGVGIDFSSFISTFDFYFIFLFGVAWIGVGFGIKELFRLISLDPDSAMIEKYKIPLDIYNAIIDEMRKDNKIRAIKLFRGCTKVSLRETKETIERFSFVVKIPMIKGFQDSNLDN